MCAEALLMVAVLDAVPELLAVLVTVLAVVFVWADSNPIEAIT